MKKVLCALLVSLVLIASVVLPATAAEATVAAEPAAETAVAETAVEEAAEATADKAAAESEPAVEPVAGTAPEATAAPAAGTAAESEPAYEPVAALKPADGNEEMGGTSIPPAAYRLYERAMEKMTGKAVDMAGTVREKGSVVADAATAGTTDTAGDAEEEVSTVWIKQLSNSDVGNQLQVKVQVGLQEFEQYYKGNYSYKRLGDLKTKTKIAFEEALPVQYSFYQNLAVDYFRNADIEETEGGKKVSINISGTDLKKLLNLPGEETGGALVSFTIDNNGFLKKWTLQYSDYTVSMKVISIGQLNQITFPDDLEAYTLV